MHKNAEENIELSDIINNDSANSNKISLSNKLIIKSIRKKNKNLFHFTLSSSFVFESRLCDFWYNKLENKNNMKINNDEIILLNKEIDLINSKSNDENTNISKIIYFDEKLKSKITEATFLTTEFNEATLAVEKIINDNNNKEKLSCLKIANIYEKKYHRKISASHVWYIMKNKLKYKFLKTAVKTAKLTDRKSILQTWFFLKVFIRVFKLKGDFIFIDESAFYTHTSNYKQWRKVDEEIFYEINDSYKVNLIMAVNTNKVLHYKITEINTTGKKFSEFFRELIDKLNEEEKNNSLFILDNCSSHLTAESFKLYDKEKIKVLYTVPYRSNFNMIEYTFRAIKNITYKKLFSSIDELKTELVIIINDEAFNKRLKLLYKEVLLNYLDFINKYKNENLN